MLTDVFPWSKWSRIYCIVLFSLGFVVGHFPKSLNELWNFKLLTVSSFKNPFKWQLHFWVYTPKNWKQVLTDTCAPVFITHNSQKTETTQIPINRWMGKQGGLYTHSGLLFILKKEWSSNTCYNMYMSFENLLGEINHTKNTAVLWFHLWGT